MPSYVLTKLLSSLILLATVLVASSVPTFAQVATVLSGNSQKPEKPITLPSPLTQQAIRDLLSTLDDKQVRALLLNRLSEQADARAKELASQDGRSLTEIVGGYGTDLLSSISITFAKVTEIPDHIAAAAAQFSQGRKGAPISLFIIAFVGSVIAGFVGAFALRRASGKLEESVVAAMPQSLWHKFRLLASSLLLSTQPRHCFLSDRDCIQSHNNSIRIS